MKINNRLLKCRTTAHAHRQQSWFLLSLATLTLYPAMALADTQNGNNVYGTGASPAITSGNTNTAYGSGAGNGSSGNSNTLIGNDAGDSASGSGNTMTGAWSGGNYHGDNAVGSDPSALDHASGTGNVGVGNWAGATSNGDSNTASGNKVGMGIHGNGNISSGLGSGYGVQGNNNVAIGSSALSQSSGSNNVVIGTNAQTYATGFDEGHMRPTGGAGITSSNSNDGTGVTVTIPQGGVGITASNVVAIGNSATSRVDNGVALGNGARVNANAANSVALGAGSVASQANTVSVGNAGNERRVTNVAAGQDDTDAVNVGQLKDAMTTFGSINNIQINNRIDHLDDKIDDNRKVSSQGIAAAMAMQIDMPEADPNGWAGGVGVGTYDGESAMALGTHYLSASGKQKISAAVSSGLSGHAKQGGRISWGFKF